MRGQSFMRRQKLSQHVSVSYEKGCKTHVLAEEQYCWNGLKSVGVKGGVADLGPTYSSQVDPVLCPAEHCSGGDVFFLALCCVVLLFCFVCAQHIQHSNTAHC